MILPPNALAFSGRKFENVFALFHDILKNYRELKPVLKTPFEQMLKGLAYWLAYKSETYKCQIIESDAVMEAVQILQSFLPSGYKIMREYPYKLIVNKKDGHMADMVILNSVDECECLIEFKLADSTNGGYVKDIDKMSAVRKVRSDIDCFVVILYRNSAFIDEPHNLLLPNGHARRTVLNRHSQAYKVKRVCSAACSHTAKKMKKVICLELL